MHTIDKGDLAVALLTSTFLLCRFTVLKPLSESLRYDLVINRGNGFERVQCKSGRLRNGAVVFNTVSSHYHLGKKSKGYIGEIELFGVYCLDTSQAYLVPVGDVPEGRGYLRVTPPLNGWKKKIVMASTYILSPL